jgi:hypothetical protein
VNFTFLGGEFQTLTVIKDGLEFGSGFLTFMKK